MADFQINDQGTVVGFTPVTDAAREWTEDHVQSESWQWMGRTLYVDHRYAAPLMDGIAEAGLSVEGT